MPELDLYEAILSSDPATNYDAHLSNEGQLFKHSLDISNIAYRPLYCLIGEKPLLVVFSIGYRAVVETSEWIRKHLGYTVLWISREIVGMRWEREQDLIGADLDTAVNAIRMRKSNKNTVILMVHMAAPHTGPWRIKQMLPEVKVVSLIYDAMNLWLPREHLHLWDQYAQAKGSNVGEYSALEDLLRGDYIEGLIYKDWGLDWPFLKDCKCPTTWVPSVMTKKMNQPPPTVNAPDRFIFIGTIMPKRTHDRPAGLFSDIMMEQIFRDVTDQGYDIHAYCMMPDPEVLEEYRRLFPEGSVRVFSGDYLSRLLFRVKGRYKWGWMLYYYPQKIILPLVENSLPSKIFTYLALGVPIVVSEEMVATCNFVREHGIGVIVSKEQIQNVRPILEAQDYEKLVANIVRTREDFCLETFMPVFGEAIRKAMVAPRKDMPSNPEFLELENAYYTQEKKKEVPFRTKSSWVDSSREIGLVPEY